MQQPTENTAQTLPPERAVPPPRQDATPPAKENRGG